MPDSKIKLAARLAHLPGQDPTSARMLGLDGIAIVDALVTDVPIASVICGRGFGDKDATDAVRRAMDLAAASNAAVVEVPDVGQVKRATGIAPAAIGDWLGELADDAAARGITIAVVNGDALRTATILWTMLERVNHPAIGCTWDIDSAWRWGETPAVSVPTLGSRIVAGRIGSADVRAQKFITRLRGIGFGGWVTLNDASIVNDSAIATVRKWITPPAPAKPVAKAPAKPRGVVA